MAETTAGQPRARPAHPTASASHASSKRLWRQARRNAAAGWTALVIAIGTGFGGAVAADIATATHVSGDPTPRSAETFTQAVEQVAELARIDPHAARLYAQREPGLPRLVEPEVQRLCGGSFAALLAK